MLSRRQTLKGDTTKMGHTIVEKILGAHGVCAVSAGDVVDIEVDARAARDFGGAKVVQNLEQHALALHDKDRAFFTFDCNPGGSDQKYAAGQHRCRLYAREHGPSVNTVCQTQ